MFAKRFEEPPRVWGIGRLVVDGGVTPWPVAQRDIEDEAESLASRLTALGVEPGGLVLIVAMLSQAMHAVPLEQAAGRVGALYSSADATPFHVLKMSSPGAATWLGSVLRWLVAEKRSAAADCSTA